MGQARRYILECEYETTSGITTVSGTNVYDLTDAFSGTSIFDSGSTFSYAAITLVELAGLADNDYEQRAEDFLSYVSQFEYSYTEGGLTSLLLNSQYEEPMCAVAPTTTTTTTLPAPTTTTTTSLAPTTTTSTTLAPTTTTTTTLPSINAYLVTRGTSGGDDTPTSDKCTCIHYSTPLAVGQTWDVCICWNLSTGDDGQYGHGCACARVVCNNVNIHSCNVESCEGSGNCNCAGAWGTTVGYGDCMHLDIFTYGDDGSNPSGYGFGYSSLCMCDSYNNVNVIVGITSPDNVSAYGCCS